MSLLGLLAGLTASCLYWPNFNYRRLYHNKFVSLCATDEAHPEPNKWGDYVVESKFLSDHPSKYGIKTITYAPTAGGKSTHVTSFVMLDGTTYYDTPSPTIWEYLLLPGLPLFGLALPMLLFKTLDWIIAGFNRST